MSTANSNGLWGPFDTWGKRLLMILGIIVLIGGPFAAWAQLNARVGAVEYRVGCIERLIEQKIDPMRDDVLVLRGDVKTIKEDVQELKERD